MPARMIYAQGDFDGACFLYSIGNAYVALRGEMADFGRLCAAMAQVDHPGDFLNGCVGTTGAYEKRYDLLEANIRRMLATLAGSGPGAPHFEVARLTAPPRPEALARLINPQSVVILRYQGSSQNAAAMDHWVCAVDCDAPGGLIHVACSVGLHKAVDEGRLYQETIHANGRRSNDVLTREREHTVIEGEVFQVSLLP